MSVPCPSKCPKCDGKCRLEVIHMQFAVEHICDKTPRHKWSGA